MYIKRPNGIFGIKSRMSKIKIIIYILYSADTIKPCFLYIHRVDIVVDLYLYNIELFINSNGIKVIQITR